MGLVNYLAVTHHGARIEASGDALFTQHDLRATHQARMRSGTGVQTPAEGIYSTGKTGGRHLGARGAAAAYMANGTAVTGVHAASVCNGLTGMIDVL